jgi:hypothetical protein
MHPGVHGPRVLAAALSLSATGALMALFRVSQPTASALTKSRLRTGNTRQPFRPSGTCRLSFSSWGTTLTHVQRSDLPLSTKARKNTHSDVRLALWKVSHQRFAFARRPAWGCGLPSLPTHFGRYNNRINQTS